jgi:hypothetical protein
LNIIEKEAQYIIYFIYQKKLADAFMSFFKNTQTMQIKSIIQLINQSFAIIFYVSSVPCLLFLVGGGGARLGTYLTCR